MSGPNVPRWLQSAARTVLDRSHEKLRTYAAPASLDAAEALKAAQRTGGEIEQLFWSHQGRQAHKWPHYFPIYDRLFSKHKGGFATQNGQVRPLRFLEIGVSHGGSLQMWRQYFGPEAVIFGIDVDPRCAAIDDANLCVRIGSQADPEFLHKVIDEMGGVDIVLDDGSHVAEHQRASLDILMPLVTEGGLYVVEDVQTSYWRKWQGGYQRAGTFIEIAKSVIDDMYARYHVGGHERAFAAHEIHSTSFYDGIVVFEKASRPASYHARVGTPSF